MENEPDYAIKMMQHIDTAVTMRLITVLEDIEGANDIANLPFYDSLNETLSFMMSAPELELLSTRDISKEWLETVANG
jgi:hypothetical protein|tara:strand:- start:608 stop:841 length:234 start_codon:yes stop_codon:yes gene_type:complete